MRALKVLLVVVLLALPSCQISKPACGYGEYRCDGNELQLCGMNGDWINWQDCAGHDATCEKGLCKPNPPH
jgi:hypothetical protein